MKKRVLILMLILLCGLGTKNFEAGEVYASEAAGTETAVSEIPDMHMNQEDISGLIDFVKEKWDSGALESEDDIREAIREGEAAFGYDLDQKTEDTVVSAIKKLSALGLDSDVIAQKARELYEKYGSSIAENVESVLKEELEETETAVGDALKEQLMEPVKEAAREAAVGVVKNFWWDLKNSVVNFVKNIFHIS